MYSVYSWTPNGDSVEDFDSREAAETYARDLRNAWTGNIPDGWDVTIQILTPEGEWISVS